MPDVAACSSPDQSGVPCAHVCCLQSSNKPEQLDLQKPKPNFTGLASWVGGAIAFGLGIWYFMGQEKAEEYFAGYLLEQSLSVDNLFVFLLVFGFFKTPEASQGKVLQYGIISAAVLRAVFILGGVQLIERFEPALGLFAGILIFSSFKLLTKNEEDDSEEDLSNNSVVQLCKRVIKATDDYDGDNFFTVLKDGSKVRTYHVSGSVGAMLLARHVPVSKRTQESRGDGEGDGKLAEGRRWVCVYWRLHCSCCPTCHWMLSSKLRWASFKLWF